MLLGETSLSVDERYGSFYPVFPLSGTLDLLKGTFL